MNYSTTTTDGNTIGSNTVTDKTETGAITLSTSAVNIDATEENCSNCTHTDVCLYKKHLEKLVGKHSIEITDIKDAVPEEAADSLSCSVEIKCKHYDKRLISHYTTPIYTVPYITPSITPSFPTDPYKITCDTILNSVSNNTADKVKIDGCHTV